MYTQISKFFYKVLINSLNTRQVSYLGEKLDRTFDIYKETGISHNIPIPRQNAAESLIHYFKEDEEIVHLFTILLHNEGKRFYDRELLIWGKEEFKKLLLNNKWVYDPDLVQFLLDPFYENDINLLKKLRVIDLREDVDMEKLIKTITDASKKLSIQDLEWRITLRLYDLDPKKGELIRKIITMLLSRQNLQIFAVELFACLKELAINASKANYKILYQKYVTSKEGITADGNYVKFLEMFRDEIDENGNSRLLELARKDDRFISIVFQSSKDSVEIWITNNQNISPIEKKQLLKKLGYQNVSQNENSYETDDYTEGAGLGLSIVLNALRKYSRLKEPLKVVFYPDYIKTGFSLMRSELLNHMPHP